MKLPDGYRKADIVGTFGDVLVMRDRHNSLYNAYSVLVKERGDNFADTGEYRWAVYAEDLDYADAMGSGAECARVNQKFGGCPESGYEE